MAISTLTIDLAANVARLQQDLSAARRQIDGFASAARTALAGLAAGISVAGISQYARGIVNAADELNKLSQKTGVSVEELSKFNYAADLSGVSAEKMGDALVRLGLSMSEASRGSGEAAKAFAAIGIAQKELATSSPDQVLYRVAEALSKVQDGAGKIEIVRTIFGKTGADLIPLLGSLRELTGEAQRLGVVISSDFAARSEALNDNLTRLGYRFRALAIEALPPVVAGLDDILRKMGETAQRSGTLAGGLRGLAEAGKLLYFGPDKAGVDAQRAYIRELEGELGSLDRKSKEVREGGLLDRVLYGSLEDIRRKRAELQVSLADARRALGLQEEAARAQEAARRAADAAKRNVNNGSGEKRTPKAKREGLSEEDQFSIALENQNFQELNRRLDEAARKRAELEDEKIRLLQEGPEIAAEQSRQLAAFLATTTEGQVQALQERSRRLVQALDLGAISERGYDAELRKIQEELARIQIAADNTFPQLANDGQAAFQRLEAAVQGWANNTNEALVNVVKRGKGEFGKLIDAVLTDLLRLQLYRSVTAPVFNALSGALGSAFGGATASPAGTPFAPPPPNKAVGGPVNAGIAYRWQENEREYFVPAVDGTVVPASRMGGGIYQTVNVFAPVDGAVVFQAARAGAALARSQLGRDMRRGVLS